MDKNEKAIIILPDGRHIETAKFMILTLEGQKQCAFSGNGEDQSLMMKMCVASVMNMMIDAGISKMIAGTMIVSELQQAINVLMKHDGAIFANSKATIQ